MNPIQKLQAKIKDRFPRAGLSLHAPVKEDGRWSLQVDCDGHSLLIEWQASNGFGVSSFDESAFGEGHDEVYADLDRTWSRVRGLLLSKGRTQPPVYVQLRRVRETLDLSQVELAERLNVRQGTVSRLEHRTDVLVSTLASVVAALGGTLEIIARFPSRTISLLRSGPGAPEDSDHPSRPRRRGRGPHAPSTRG